ncbi:quinone oxidoreductase family protein [Anabaena sp. FACHB-709]|nr:MULTISPECIES: quinone oxidoreductase family protein [Nostocaceae]HBW32716.1 alcohol dehydrogenase [Nostoc sp. UBA8866]MBD2172578.1 zinc-binding dehydrogenase [Anabaena cylindrica FACHB-318]MBD2264450.1 zinc-binding dehydrogenase [Anabaena sp. FACHB-709]MBD2274221.1 zinc-binding dehydrogenase [Nostoc sp. PCC 7120 = FACHB-418]MBD2284710.1 zinc-binding dehydrogenase [Anabaena cylindrica FACHB-170]
MKRESYRKLIAKGLSQDFKSAAEIVEVPIPQVGIGQLLIENKFAGINGGFDTLVCRGDIPYFEIIPPFDLGVEAVGKVVAVGENVTGFQIGDAVVTTVRGSGYREYQVIDANLAVKVREATPEVLTLMPTGVSALVALEQVGEMTSNEVVLVTAAAGGTGHIAVQLAKLAGNHVIGTCSSEAKSKLLKALGCDRIINYRTENLDQVLKQEYPKGINLIFECVGKDVFDTCVDNLAIRGRLVSIGHISEYGKNVEPVTQARIYHQLMWKAASVRGFLTPYYQEYIPEAGDRLLNLFYNGKLQVSVDPTQFNGLESIPTAVEYLLSGHNCGKVVVKF